ncbi:hypothetical protein D3C71_1727080 [compost metagenome]
MISTSAGTSVAAVASAIASTKMDSAVAGSNRPGARDSCSRVSASRTGGHNASAMGVGSTPWPLRTTSSSPTTSRKRRMALLTAGWVMDSLWAARVRLRSAITSSKTRNRFRSRARKFKGVIADSSPS